MLHGGTIERLQRPRQRLGRAAAVAAHAAARAAHTAQPLQHATGRAHGSAAVDGGGRVRPHDITAAVKRAVDLSRTDTIVAATSNRCSRLAFQHRVWQPNERVRCKRRRHVVLWRGSKRPAAAAAVVDRNQMAEASVDGAGTGVRQCAPAHGRFAVAAADDAVAAITVVASDDCFTACAREAPGKRPRSALEAGVLVWQAVDVAAAGGPRAQHAQQHADAELAHDAQIGSHALDALVAIAGAAASAAAVRAALAASHPQVHHVLAKHVVQRRRAQQQLRRAVRAAGAARKPRQTCQQQAQGARQTHAPRLASDAASKATARRANPDSAAAAAAAAVAAALRVRCRSRAGRCVCWRSRVGRRVGRQRRCILRPRRRHARREVRQRGSARLSALRLLVPPRPGLGCILSARSVRLKARRHIAEHVYQLGTVPVVHRPTHA
eukprot:359157-Chlamydomonas_euryale.AAC.4